MMAEDGKHLIADNRARACNKKLGNGVGRFFPNLRTPPKRKGVMLHTEILYRSATTECPSSWRSTLNEERHSGDRAHQPIQ
jgi:hypothetical protein